MNLVTDLRTDASFSNFWAGKAIIKNADTGVSHGSVPYKWLSGVFTQYGVSLVAREKCSQGIPELIVVAERPVNGAVCQYKSIYVRGKSGSVAIHNARKALQVLGLL